MSLKQIEANALGHFEYLPMQGGYDVARVDGLTLIRCGLNSSMFNIVYGGVPESGESGVNATIQATIDYYGSQPFAWWVPPSAQSPLLSELLLAKGFTIEADENALCLALYSTLENTGNKALTVEFVRGADQLNDFISVLEVYDPTARTFYESLSAESLEGAEQLYIGYAEKRRPVCTGVLFINDESAGIFGVITDERERGKGFGTEMMKHLLDEARGQSLKTVTLSASSDSGLRIYERLGFKRLGQFECFEWQGA